MSPDPFSAAFSADRRLELLGVDIFDVTIPRAIEQLDAMIRRGAGGCRAVYFVNAHTLNLACSEPGYRDVLNQADAVFGDGTGVRWAARLRGVRLQDNVNGTDLMPAAFDALNDRGYSYFLLGSDETSVAGAAENVRRAYPGWNQVGYHHGYLVGGELEDQVIEKINAARPDVLLVGMGNPIQERWIHRHRDRLQVSVALAVGGLIDYWSGRNHRAPRWMRRCGCEWVGVVLRQPRKMRRYLVGNPLFLARIARQWWRDRTSCTKR
jgi:N-acetylglucosaminyldiphosphoundecaprenol N-acetyl-beta-D-mannosaminyltransferase